MTTNNSRRHRQSSLLDRMRSTRLVFLNRWGPQSRARRPLPGFDDGRKGNEIGEDMDNLVLNGRRTVAVLLPFMRPLARANGGGRFFAAPAACGRKWPSM
jgi:hypothetical protein